MKPDTRKKQPLDANHIARPCTLKQTALEARASDAQKEIVSLRGYLTQAKSELEQASLLLKDTAARLEQVETLSLSPSLSLSLYIYIYKYICLSFSRSLALYIYLSL